MAEDKTKEIIKRDVDELRSKAEINEAYFVGLLWSDPFNNYSEYSENITQDEFIHDVWGYFFELGRRMYSDGVKMFDDITIATKIKEYNIIDEFKEFGGSTTIDDAVNIVKENIDNITYYYDTIKKNYVVRQLYLLFGDKIFINKGKYNWKRLSGEELTMFWNDKVNKLSLNGVTRYEAENLYIDPEIFIKKLEEDSAEVLPFYNSYMMNTITQGTARGHVFMFGGFGNSGKSSIVAEKFVMSCIENKEKTIIVLNEENAQSFRQKMVLSILFHEFHTGIDRKRMVNGKLEEKDKEKIRKAFVRMHELIEGEDALIKVIFMERYIMRDLEKIIRFWANRGYVNLVIDTHKVSDDSHHDKRWETFVEDMKTIYRITRAEAGGCNLRTIVTFQLVDGAIKNRYLTFDAIGEGKAAKNEASTVMMFRSIWSDEYEGEGKKSLECYRNRQNEKTKEYEKEFFKLEKGKPYYLLFTPKNRTGPNNDNGQPVLVIEPQFNSNHFKEIGWTFVAKDFN